MDNKKEVARAGFAIAGKIYDDTGWFRNLLIMSGLHNEAAKMTEAMMLIESVGAVLQELGQPNNALAAELLTVDTTDHSKPDKQ